MTSPARENFPSNHVLPQKMLWELPPKSPNLVKKPSRRFSFEFSSVVGKLSLREKQRGVENSGGGKHTIKPLPRNGFGPPPPMIRFPTPHLFSPCCFP